MAIREMEILDVTGHTTRKWDTSNEADMKAVERIFDDLTRKGYKAFSVTKGGAGGDGSLGQPRSTFDPEAEKMLMVPPIQAG